MKIPYIINNDKEITVYFNGQMRQVFDTDKEFLVIKENLLSENWDRVIELMDIFLGLKKKIEQSKLADKIIDDIVVEKNSLKYKDMIISGDLFKKFKQCLEDDESVDPLILFIKNIYENPKKEIFKEMYDFLDRNDVPITHDGHFLTFKKITGNWKDCHSKTIDNSIGQKPRMDRDKCNSDAQQTCVAGLHVCGANYLSQFYGDRIIICKVNPRDVIAIPNDYNFSKMRVCEYEVIKEVQKGTNTIDELSRTAVDLFKNKNIVKEELICEDEADENIEELKSRIIDLMINDKTLSKSIQAYINKTFCKKCSLRDQNPNLKQMIELVEKGLKTRPKNKQLNKIAVRLYEIEKDEKKSNKKVIQEKIKIDIDELFDKMLDIIKTDNQTIKAVAATFRQMVSKECENTIESIKSFKVRDEVKKSAIIKAKVRRPNNKKLREIEI